MIADEQPAPPPPPESFDAGEWIEWLSDVSSGGYMDLKIPAAAVSWLCGALDDPRCRGALESWARVLLEVETVQDARFAGEGMLHDAERAASEPRAPGHWVNGWIDAHMLYVGPPYPTKERSGTFREETPLVKISNSAARTMNMVPATLIIYSKDRS